MHKPTANAGNVRHRQQSAHRYDHAGDNPKYLEFQ